MKKSKLFTTGVLALGLVFGLVLAGCDSGDDGGGNNSGNNNGGGNTAVTFSSVTANGSSTQTTTQLTLTFSQAITGLSAGDITLSGVSGVSKGTLSGSGPVYTLGISGFTSGGTLSVAVAKSGYTISGSPKTVPIYYNGNSGDDIAVIFGSVTANGSSSQTTTELTLTFSQAITGLSAGDITLSGVSGVSKGTLSSSDSTYTLPISGFTSGGTLNVAVAKSGYTISGSPQTVPIYYSGSSGGGDIAVTFSSVTANGSSSQTTTQLTLTFSQAITGLSASDITLSGVSGVSKGTLSGSGPTYTLGISGFTAGGTLSVAVAKSGYDISGSPKSTTIYYYSAPLVQPPSAPTGVTATRNTATPSTVRITWNAVSGATSYKVYYSSSSSGSGSLDGTPTTTSFDSTNNSTTATVYFRVSAVNSAGEGTPSSWVSVGPVQGGGTQKLSTPTGLQAYSGGSFVQISFNTVSLAQSYKLYRATSATGTYSEITASGGSSGSGYTLTDSSPRTGTSYYKVRAIPPSSLNYTESDLSDYVSVTR